MKLTPENLDYPDCRNPDRETGVNAPYSPHLGAATKAREAARWVAEHTDQFENDCRPLGRETRIVTPSLPHLETRKMDFKNLTPLEMEKLDYQDGRPGIPGRDPLESKSLPHHVRKAIEETRSRKYSPDSEKPGRLDDAIDEAGPT